VRPPITRDVIDHAVGGGQAGAVSTRETVEELLRRIAAGDPDETAQLYADEVDWRLDWPDGDHAATVPWICHRSTRAGVADHFRLIGELRPGCGQKTMSAGSMPAPRQ
jgi:hypothetical protein